MFTQIDENQHFETKACSREDFEIQQSCEKCGTAHTIRENGRQEVPILLIPAVACFSFNCLECSAHVSTSSDWFFSETCAEAVNLFFRHSESKNWIVENVNEEVDA